MADLDPVATVADSDGNISKAIMGGIAGVFTVMFTAVAVGIEAITSVFVDPLVALATELGDLIQAYIPAELMSDAVTTSADSLGQFGPLAYPAGMAIMAAGLYILSWLLSQEITSDLVPFSTTDWPVIGADEEDEEVG